ncbi:hypothetical protein O3M35_008490 [Rhynocoris fuscipes]|uniref:Uncharacterized protein n=1 Tax=Rhynocoris fuscipes TaxID=488301 RepID=A0AAW1D949_9HEMI
MVRDLVSSLLDEKLAHISTKNHLKDLSNYIKDLKEENILLKTEIVCLKELTFKMDSLLEELEISANSKNVIFKSVKNSPSDDPKKTKKKKKNFDLFQNNCLQIF